MEKEQREKKLDENILKILVENLSVMKLFRVNDKIFNDVKNYYIQVYNIDKEMIKKEINYFYKENNFTVNEENERELIKGQDKEFLIQNIKENNNDGDEKDKNIINEEKSEKKEETKIEEKKEDDIIEGKKEDDKNTEKKEDEKKEDDKIENNEEKDRNIIIEKDENDDNKKNEKDEGGKDKKE